MEPTFHFPAPDEPRPQIMENGDHLVMFSDFAHHVCQLSESQRVRSMRIGYHTDWARLAVNYFPRDSAHILIVNLLGISNSDVEVCVKDGKRLGLSSSERLDRIAAVVVLAEDVFECKVAAANWLSTENKALGGKTPISLCDTEIGAKQVRRVLHAIEWGNVA